MNFSFHNIRMPKPVVILLVSLGIVVYIIFIIWFFNSGTIFKKTSNLSGASQMGNPTATPVPPTPKTPTPTPTPLQGPGQYACDPQGICNNYSDIMRKNCPVTFADRNCLEQCGNAAKRCTQ